MSRALLVGINACPSGVYHDNPLAGCRADALGYRRLLLAHGWRDSEIVTLYDEAATAAKIREELVELRAAALAGATVLLAYSGHGAEDGDRCVLVPSDFRWGQAEHQIGPDDLREAFRGVDPARATLILDMCHAAGADGVRGLGHTRTGPTRVRSIGRRPGHAPAAHVRGLASLLDVPLLAACGSGQTAADLGPEGGAFSVSILRAWMRPAVLASPMDDVVALVNTSMHRRGLAQHAEASGPCGRPLFGAEVAA